MNELRDPGTDLTMALNFGGVSRLIEQLSVENEIIASAAPGGGRRFDFRSGAVPALGRSRANGVSDLFV
jgi:hypothetical protein